MFVPQHVDAFLNLADKEYIWLDLAHKVCDPLEIPGVVELDLGGLLDLAKLFSHIIDFRSRFTATHSAGIAIVSETLGRLAACVSNPG